MAEERNNKRNSEDILATGEVKQGRLLTTPAYLSKKQNW